MEPSGKDEASSSKDTMNCALPDAPLPNVEPDAGPRLQDLPDAVLGLIWRMLDTESQHRWMQASKAIATSPAVLAQIDGINVVGEEPVSQLLRFPRKASLRRLGATQLAGICSTLQAWADDRRCRLLLYGLQELRVRVELPSTSEQREEPISGDMCYTLASLCPALQVLELKGWLNEPGCIAALLSLSSLMHLKCQLRGAAASLQGSMQHLAVLSQLTGLQLSTAIDVADNNVDTVMHLDVSPLCTLSQLQRLTLYLQGAQLKGVQALGSSCRKLTQFCLDAASVLPEQEQEQVTGHAHLRWPVLSEAELRSLGMGSLGAMGLQHAQHLQRLSLEQGHLHLGEVSRMSSLKGLTLCGPLQQGSVLDVSCLSALAQLRSLKLIFLSAELSGVHVLAASCTQLSSLDLAAVSFRQRELLQPAAQVAGGSSSGDGSGSSSLPPSSWWPALTKVLIKSDPGGGLAELGLRHAPAIQELIFIPHQLQLEEVSQLAPLKKLSLHWWHGYRSGGAHVDVSPLGNLKHLQRLYLGFDTGVRCTGIPAIAQGCTSLTSLKMSTFTILPDQQQPPEQQEQLHGQAQGQQQQHRWGQEAHVGTPTLAEEAGMQSQANESDMPAQAQGQQQQEQKQLVKRVRWWPVLETASVGYRDSYPRPGQVTALQLHRAQFLQELQLQGVQLVSNQLDTDAAAFAEMCRQLVACPGAARPRAMSLMMERPPPHAPLLSCMAPLAGSLTSLSFSQGDGGEEMHEADTHALAAALPGLQRLSLSCRDSMPGAAVVHLVTQLQQLKELVLNNPCSPASDVVAAASAAQEQVAAGTRAKPLTIKLEGRWRNSHELQEVKAAVAQLQVSGQQLDPQHVRFKWD